ncbi:MAG: hypothetical protein NTY45_00165 [Elusimicrobia bacterium]|nr:hypothetical protein [Elusimicrobiota bacterium]
MKKVTTMIVMLGLTCSAYAAEDAVKALAAQAPEAAGMSVAAVSPAEALPAKVSPLQQEFNKRAELFETGALVQIGDLPGGNLFGVRHADLLSAGKDGELKHGDAYLSVFAQDSGRFADAAPVYGISAKLNSEFAYEADYIPYNYVVINTLRMNVSPHNRGTASVAVREIKYNGPGLLIVKFTEKFLSGHGEHEFTSYGLLDSRK